MNFGSKFLNIVARHTQRLLYAASITSDFTCIYCTAAGAIFGIFIISIFMTNYNIFFLYYKNVEEILWPYSKISLLIGKKLHPQINNFR